MVTKVTLPHNEWTPRPHQIELWKYLREQGGKRAMAVWHRRAGKDDVCLHHTAVSAWERIGNFWHCLPEYAQARKAIWTAINPHTGKRRIDEAFPQAMRANTSDTEMFIRFKNGSTWQCIGSDRYDATVGSGAAGIVYSEWALANPSAWAYHRPMLEENGGWAVFISTPRGRNHAFTMFNHAKQSPDWFAELLTATDTEALSEGALAEALKEYTALYGEDVGRAQYQQEYFCDFQAAILGAFYSLEMAQLRNEGRVLACEAAPDQYVHRAWDLGVTDDTSIWWFQIQGAQIVVLDHYANSGAGVEHYADEIRKREAQHGWKHGTDFVPHDAKIKEWGSGRTRVETMQALGLKPLLVPMASIADGINAVRRTLPLCVFHPRTEETGIAALEQYRREWDDEKKAFRATHVHDWTSHPADAFRYLALAWKLIPRQPVEAKVDPGAFVIPPPPDVQDYRGMRL
jgi:phage terminase large subunit